MSSRPPWMALYVADYLADTRHLETIEHGAYILLIMEYWRKGKLPTDDKNLQKICGLSSYQWKHRKPVIASLFGTNWRHERIEQELKKAYEISLKRSVYGSKGARTTNAKRPKPLSIVPWKPKNDPSKS